MAKFEEADPRWKVRDLGDQGKNVNAWHWTESDCLPWFKAEFASKFDGDDNKIMSCTMDGGKTAELWCHKLESCTGEAQINRRKGNKVMVLYEMEVKIKWKALISDSDGKEISSARGNYNMPSLDTVDAIDDFEIQTKPNKDTPESKQAYEFAKTSGAHEVRKMIVESIKKLQAEAGVGGGSVPKPLAAATNGTAAAPAAKPAAAAAPAKKSAGGSETVEVEFKFNAPAKEVFECFTVPQKLMAYMQSRCEVGTAPGARLVLFDGSITGETVSCTQNEKLVWLWRQSSWAEGKMSTATLTFDQTAPGTTVVKLVHTGVPSSDVHGNSNMKRVVEEGWKQNIFERIKAVFFY